MAEAVESKIQSGRYASVSDLIRDGIEELLARDAAVEHWLRDEVVAGHAENLTDPSHAVPSEDILPRLGARRAAAKTL